MSRGNCMDSFTLHGTSTCDTNLRETDWGWLSYLDLTHDNPLSSQLKTAPGTVRHPLQCYAALPHAVFSSAAITQCCHKRRCRSLLLACGKRTAVRHTCQIAAPYNVSLPAPGACVTRAACTVSSAATLTPALRK